MALHRRIRGVLPFDGVNVASPWLRQQGTRLSVVALELGLIVLWACIVARPYLNLDPNQVPFGREFLSAIESHHIWTLFKRCGWCALWNGSVNGGYPAFADPYGAMLHPFVIVTTLLWGVVDGAKRAVVAALIVAGVAQWWLGRVLNVGRIARLWAALLAVAGGHLAGRMEIGVFAVLLSTAVGALVFPPLLMLARGERRWAPVLLGWALGSALLAGQGYIQLGLGLAVAPAFLLCLGRNIYSRREMNTVIFGLVLGVLLAGPFLMPFLRFYPQFAKDVDPDFTTAQPLVYLPLNLVIHDVSFFYEEALGRAPLPYLYMAYIGWVPVLLAVVALVRARSEDRPGIYFLTSAALLTYVLAGAEVLRWLAKLFPEVGLARHPSLIAGLAVPPILGLASYGLDNLLRIRWMVSRAEGADAAEAWRVTFRPGWILILPLVWNLKMAYDFSSGWYKTVALPQETFKVLEALQTPDLAWVQPPFGEHWFVEPAIREGLKVSQGLIAWRWRDRQPPTPLLEATRGEPPPDALEQVARVEDIRIFRRMADPYAFVQSSEAKHPCSAHGMGGVIEVHCRSELQGLLIVQENMFPGWRAWLDGDPVQLARAPWLTIRMPNGEHTARFEYRPVDVWLGLIALMIGLVLSVAWPLRLWDRRGSPVPHESG